MKKSENEAGVVPVIDKGVEQIRRGVRDVPELEKEKHSIRTSSKTSTVVHSCRATTNDRNN